MPVRAVDDKPSDTLVVVSGEGFWTGSSTLPHLHHSISTCRGRCPRGLARARALSATAGAPAGRGPSVRGATASRRSALRAERVEDVVELAERLGHSVVRARGQG